jgi:hypothetical protein
MLFIVKRYLDPEKDSRERERDANFSGAALARAASGSWLPEKPQMTNTTRRQYR